MPISQWHTGCYWTAGGRQWIVLEDGNAVEDGLHDLRALNLARNERPGQCKHSRRGAVGADRESARVVGPLPPRANHDLLGRARRKDRGLGRARPLVDPPLDLGLDFAEPHLSAIQWLNRHTDDEFAFFAVRLRVVRIADSPLAPTFEIAAKPNRWERQVRHKSAGPRAELVKTCREFWTHYAQRYPEDGIRANHGLANFWVRPRRDAPAISLAFLHAGGAVGIFFTPKGLSEQEMKGWRDERQKVVKKAMGRDQAEEWESFDTHNRDNWDAMCD